MVRVDFYKPSGKWYMTEAYDMSEWYDMPDLHKAIGEMLDTGATAGWWKRFNVVVLEPYHKYAHPQMIVATE